MSGRLEVRSYDYVNHPWTRVRDALSESAEAVFAAATHAAASRARAVASQLRVNVGGVEVAADIEIAVTGIEHVDTGPEAPQTRIHLRWEAAQRPGLFPLMNATLSIYPLTSTETQLDFAGHYEPPLGAVGAAIDAMVGHRIAEASVHRFVSDVAAHLRTSLGRS
jgi:hypothetical protein